MSSLGEHLAPPNFMPSHRLAHIRSALSALLALAWTASPVAAADTPEPQRPDLVVFLSDDHTWRDSTVYGSEDMPTPNMARLAAAGMTFDRAYVASPSCAPSRAALLTGLYPQNNGAIPNHSRPHAELKKLPVYFQELGYEVVSFGKVGHYRQSPEYGFDIARLFTFHAHEAIPEAVKWLRERGRDPERPLCLFVGTNWPHVPWPADPGDLAPGDFAVPPHHIDHPVTREWRAKYAAAVRKMDDELGLVYDAAREVLGEDVFFLHTSDHGAQWPYGKWTLYEDGIRTPMIAAWPGRVAPGTRSDAMVSWIDLLPTLLDAAGAPAPEGLDGRSFLPVMEGRTDSLHERIFTTHSGDGNNNVFPIRAVTTDDGWKYIRNLRPELHFFTHVTRHLSESRYWDAWVDAAIEDPAAQRLVREYLSRAEEELYHFDEDPWERANLAADPAHAARLAELREVLDEWMEETGDTPEIYGRPIRIAGPERPNIVTIFVDDMGWSDLGAFGGTEIETPQLDRLAAEGLRFSQFYVQSPICSPSRVALSTGQYPQRWRITSFLNHRENNRERGVDQWLDPEAPMLARELRHAGYATGHFGKWHMGGQRDVDDAPPIFEYGFDRSLTNFEGMGPKLLPLVSTPGSPEPSRIWERGEILGGPYHWTPRHEITGGFVEAALTFIDRAGATGQPFYINLWPDDPHGPWFPSIDHWSEDPRERYQAVVREMDAQLGPLFDRLREDEALRDNTLVIFCSDNGPDPGIGSSAPLRGAKTWLYEAGIRSPLIVWGPGLIPAERTGTANERSVFSAIDIARSLYAIAGVPLPEGHVLDGEDLSETLLGRTESSREAPLFWRRPPDRPGFGHGFDDEKNPDLAVREGRWKLLLDFDGGSAGLYDLEADPSESSDLAADNPEIVERLREVALAWNRGLPADAGDPAFVPPPPAVGEGAAKGKGKGKGKGTGSGKATGKAKAR